MKDAQLIILGDITVYSPGVLMQNVKGMGDPRPLAPSSSLNSGWIRSRPRHPILILRRKSGASRGAAARS